MQAANVVFSMYVVGGAWKHGGEEAGAAYTFNLRVEVGKYSA